MYQSILEWALGLISAGGLGSAITYLFTIKSKKRISEAEAEETELEVEHKRLDFQQDQYEYLQKQCDKYITDYHALESEFRNKVKELQEELNNIMITNQHEIQDKCIEIATLKSKMTYLKGVSCYNFTCPHRIKDEPQHNSE